MLVAFAVLAFFTQTWKMRFKSPVIEVLVNIFLLLGLVLNIFIGYQVQILFFLGNLPIIILFLYKLIENHQFFILNFKPNEDTLEKYAFLIMS